MKQIYIDILKSFGVTDSQISIITPLAEKESLESSDKKTVDNLVNEAKKNLTNIIMADPSTAEDMRKQGYGRAKNEDEILVKKVFGLTQEEMTGKKFDELLSLAHSKMEEKVTQDKKTILEENIRLVNELKTIQEEVIPSIKSEVQSTIKNYENDQWLIANLSNAEKRKILGKPDAILPSIKVQLDQMNLIIKENKDGIKEIVHKETNLQLRADDGSKLLNNDEVLDKILDKSGLLEKSTPSLKEPVIIPKTEGIKTQTNNNLGLSVAEEHLKELKSK